MSLAQSRSFSPWCILLVVCGLLSHAVALHGAEKWPFVTDPPASAPAWAGLEGKTLTLPTTGMTTGSETVLPATGAPVLLTGHATGSTSRSVWLLTDFSQIGTLTGRLDTAPGGFALSPDGQTVTVIKKRNFSSLGAEVWSVRDGKRTRSLDMGPTSEPVIWSAFTSATTLLTLHEGEQGKTKVRITNIVQDNAVVEFEGPTNINTRVITLSPGGQLLATSTQDGAMLVMDLRDKQPHKPFPIAPPKGYGKCIAAKFAPDGTELGAAFANTDADLQRGDIALAAWSLQDGQPAMQHSDVRLGMISELIPPVPGSSFPTGVALDWLPDGSALLLANKILIDRETGHGVWRLRLPVTGLEKLPNVFLGTDYLLIPRKSAQAAQYEALKLPWQQIDTGLKAVQSKSPAWLQRGDKISLHFEFGGLRFQTPDQVRTALTARLQTKLQEEELDVAENQPVSLKIAYAETIGTTLQRGEDTFPFPGLPNIRRPRFPRPPTFPLPRDMADEAVGTGTAFIIHPDGYLLTCAHVVGSAPSVQVKIGEQNYHGRVVAKNVAHDYALLKVEVKNLPVLPLSDSTKLELGEEVRAVGYPISSLLGETIKVTRGTLAGMVKKNGQTLFQVDASINPGNSGGPLVNDLGEVVGINSAKLVGADVDNIGFSIPINAVKDMLKEQKVTFESKGSATKLAGPELIKRVTPAVAFVTSTGGIDRGPAGDHTVVVTRIACLITLNVKGHPEPVWTEQIVVEPQSLRIAGELTEEKARDVAFETLNERLEALSLPYYISKDQTPITLPVVTDLTAEDHHHQPVSSPRKTRRGLSN